MSQNLAGICPPSSLPAFCPSELARNQETNTKSKSKSMAGPERSRRLIPPLAPKMSCSSGTKFPGGQKDKGGSGWTHVSLWGHCGFTGDPACLRLHSTHSLDTQSHKRKNRQHQTTSRPEPEPQPPAPTVRPSPTAVHTRGCPADFIL